MNARERRMEINLRTLGNGVIFLGAWSFIKYALTFLITGTFFNGQLNEIETIVANIFAWIVITLHLLLSLYIGLSARSEGKGKHKTIFYLIVTGLLIIFYIAGVVGDIALLFLGTDGIFTIIITLIIDLTAVIILIEMMCNAIGIRRMRKKEATA